MIDDKREIYFDKKEILDLEHKYCRAIDRRDYSLLSSLYHPDAKEDHGGMFNGTISEYLEWLPSMLESMEITMHMVINSLIEVQGDKAEGEFSILAYHKTQSEEGPIDILTGGRNLDFFEKKHGIWKFTERHIVLEFNQIHPSECNLDLNLFEGVELGKDKPEDPSYKVFNFFLKK